jgi:hypothetical protein
MPMFTPRTPETDGGVSRLRYQRVYNCQDGTRDVVALSHARSRYHGTRVAAYVRTGMGPVTFVVPSVAMLCI